MKIWISPDGYFSIKIPLNWQFLNETTPNLEEEMPFSFCPYDQYKSCINISRVNSDTHTKGRILSIKNDQLQWRKCKTSKNKEGYLSQLYFSVFGEEKYFIELLFLNPESNEPEFVHYNQCLRTILRSFNVFPKSQRESVVAVRHQKMFVQALAGAAELLDKSIRSGCYIETIVLSLLHIDAFLRDAIVKHNQITDNSLGFDVRYYYQASSKYISERQIYREAEDLKIISEEELKYLNFLYDERNRVVHRFVFTPIKTAEIRELSRKCCLFLGVIRNKLESIEQQLDKKYWDEPVDSSLKLSMNEMKYLVTTWARDKHNFK